LRRVSPTRTKPSFSTIRRQKYIVSKNDPIPQSPKPAATNWFRFWRLSATFKSPEPTLAFQTVQDGVFMAMKFLFALIMAAQ
jgi:hypothetical protein